MNVELTNVSASELSFINKIEKARNVELQNTYSYSVKYANNNTCVGEMSISVEDKEEPEKFNIKANVIGIFKILSDAEKQVLHVETFNALFPYAKSMVTNLTTICGIPPVYIPSMDIAKHSIYKIDTNPPKEQ